MIELAAGHLRLKIEEPGEGYGESRFDQTGKIVQVWWHDIPMCTSELGRGEAVQQGKGLFNEFGISKAIGYDETEIGDFFPKIGVGMLRKENNEPYDFFHNYECVPFNFTHEQSDSSVTFRCANSIGKYAFLLEKTISMTTNGFFVDYRLRNDGMLVLNTSEYVHNFFSPGNRNISQKTKLVIGSNVDYKQFSSGLNPNHCMFFSGEEIRWMKTPDSDFFFENISMPKEKDLNWKLFDDNLDVSISETVDFKPERINLWGRSHVICPEVFKPICLEPGKTDRWQRFFEIKKIECATD